MTQTPRVSSTSTPTPRVSPRRLRAERPPSREPELTPPTSRAVPRRGGRSVAVDQAAGAAVDLGSARSLRCGWRRRHELEAAPRGESLRLPIRFWARRGSLTTSRFAPRSSPPASTECRLGVDTPAERARVLRVDEDRADRLVRACAQRNRADDVLVLDTRIVLGHHCGAIELTMISAGATLFPNAPSGAEPRSPSLAGSSRGSGSSS
jgi:hypothetical protein